MKYTIAFSMLAALSTTQAFAQDEVTSDTQSLPTEQYHYGMKVDVAKVIHLSGNQDRAGLTRSVMIYKDPQGEVHKLQYLIEGTQQNQNG